MREYQLRKSTRKNKKYVLKGDGITTHFGDDRYKDFVLMNTRQSRWYEPSKEIREKTRANYRSRHANDNLDDPTSPGALSYYLLWNLPTLKASIRDFEKRFGIKINL
jgi:hypothetical protein